MAWNQDDRKNLRENLKNMAQSRDHLIKMASNEGTVVAIKTPDVETLMKTIQDEIVTVMAAVFYGQKGKKYKDIDSTFGNMPDCMSGLADLSKKFKDVDVKQIQTNITNISTSLTSLLNSLNAIQSEQRRGNKKIGGSVSLTIKGVSNASAKALQELYSIFINNKVDKNIAKNIIKLLKNTDKIFETAAKMDTDVEKAKHSIEKIKFQYKDIEELFDYVTQVGVKADASIAANKKIKGGLDDVSATATSAADNGKKAESLTINIQSLGKVILMAGIVMLIGALIIEANPNLVKSAVKFGVVLGLFIAATMGPIMLIGKFANPAVLAYVGEFNKIIICCAAIMMIGAAFMLLGSGKMVKNALQFGVILGVFETLVMLPFLMFALIESDVLKSVKSIMGIIILSTVLMMVAALFSMDAKRIVNILKFAAVLGLFEALLVAPFLLFGVIEKDVLSGLRGVMGIIILSTILMMIASIFVMDKKRIVNILKFAAVLGLFEVLLIAPFLLFNILKDYVADGLKNFMGVVILSAFLMMIGALVMKDKTFPLRVLEFAGLLAAFEVAIVAPMLLFNKIKAHVADGIRDFTMFVLVCAGAMIIGPAVMKMFKIDFLDVLGFTTNMAIFVAAMSGIFIAILAAMNIIKNGGKLKFLFFASTEFKGVGQDFVPPAEITNFAISVGMLALCMTMGPVILKMFKINFGQISAFTGGLAIFIAEIGAAFAAVIAVMRLATAGGNGGLTVMKFLSGSPLEDGAKSNPNNPIIQFGITVGILAACMTLGPAVIKLTGLSYSEVDEFTEQLEVFVLAIGGIFTGIVGILGIINGVTGGGVEGVGNLLSGTPMDGADKGGGAGPILQFGITVGILAAAMTLGPIIVKYGGITYEEIDSFANKLEWFVGWMGVIFVAICGVMSTFSGGGKGGNAAAGADGILSKVGLSGFGNSIGSSPIIQFAVATMLLAATIVAGPIILKQFNVGETEVAAFGVITFLFVAGMSRVLKYLSKMSLTEIGKGALAIAGIGLIILGLGFVFGYVGKAFKDIPDATVIPGLPPLKGGAVIGYITSMALSVAELGLFMLAVGAMVTNPFVLVALAAGAGTLAGIGAIIIELSYAIIKLKEANDALKAMGPIDGQKLFESMVQPFIDMIVKLPDEDTIEDWEDKADALLDFARPMGKVIKTISTSICDMANLKVATNWNENGDPIEFRQLNNSDFDLARKNVGRILTTMAFAFMDAANGTVTTFNDDGTIKGVQKVAGSVALKDLSWNELLKVLTVCNQMGEIIGEIGQSVGKIAVLMVPDQWDPKTGKPTHYLQLSEDHFLNMGINVGKIITSIAGAFGEVYKNNPDLFAEPDSWWKRDTPVKRVVEGVKGMTEVVSMMADSIIKIGGCMVPKPDSWDSDKKVFKSYEKINITSIGTDLSSTLQDMTTTVLGAFATVINDNPGIFGLKTKTVNGKTVFILEDEDNDSPIIVAAKGFQAVFGATSDMIDTLIKMAECYVPDYNHGAKYDPKTGKFDKYTKADFNRIGKQLGTTLTTMVGLVVGALKTTIKQFPDIFGVEFKITTDANGKTKYTIKDTADADENPIVIIGNGLAAVTGAVGNIVDTLIKIANGKYPTGKWDPEKKDFTDYKPLNLGELSTNLETNLTKIIGAFVVAITSQAAIFQKGGALEPDKLNVITEGMGKVNTVVNSIVTTVKSIKEILQTTDDGTLQTDILTKITQGFTDFTNSVNTGINLLTNNGSTQTITNIDTLGKNLTTLADGLDKVNKAIQQAKVNKEFTKNNENINKFVKDTVNKIDVNRINRLITLTNAFIKLADKTTNLDKLTTAITDKLTVSLEHLSEKLDESKNTIMLAETIQDKRHERIDRSIKEITKIMSQEIKVKVTAEGQNNSYLQLPGTNPGAPQPETQVQTPGTVTGEQPSPSISGNTLSGGASIDNNSSNFSIGTGTNKQTYSASDGGINSMANKMADDGKITQQEFSDLIALIKVLIRKLKEK